MYQYGKCKRGVKFFETFKNDVNLNKRLFLCNQFQNASNLSVVLTSNLFQYFCCSRLKITKAKKYNENLHNHKSKHNRNYKIH